MTRQPILAQSGNTQPSAGQQRRSVKEIIQGLGLDLLATSRKQSARSSNKAAPLAPLASNDEFIREPGRNSALTSLAGSMRRRGMTEAAILAGLQAENAHRCIPPLDSHEVEAIVKSIMRYPSAQPEELRKSLNDIGNAERFGRASQDNLRYVPAMGWHAWDEHQWRRDTQDAVMELAKDVARAIYSEEEAVQDNDLRTAIAQHARASHQAPRLKAMLELAKTLPSLVVSPAKLDVNGMLLGVANGVVDLLTGKLRVAKREDLITRHSGVVFDKKAVCPQFEKFIDQVTLGDKTLAAYLQRVVGYTLTGNTNEQCLFFLYGHGANGKSTFLNIIKELLGPDLARQTPTETLMANRTSTSNDLARLQNVRLVIANEVDDGSLLAEALVKQMTGGEPITARFHYQEFFEFAPKFKLFIAGNHKPTIRGRDNGIWRRIRLIPFQASFAQGQRDKHLAAKLGAELPGILNWAIKGCSAWQKSGLGEPACVQQAVAEYRDEMDVVGVWLTERCDISGNLETSASQAYQSYKRWAEDNGYRPMSSGSFSREFADRFHKAKRKNGNYFLGVQCR